MPGAAREAAAQGRLREESRSARCNASQRRRRDATSSHHCPSCSCHPTSQQPRCAVLIATPPRPRPRPRLWHPRWCHWPKLLIYAIMQAPIIVELLMALNVIGGAGTRCAPSCALVVRHCVGRQLWGPAKGEPQQVVLEEARLGGSFSRAAHAMALLERAGPGAGGGSARAAGLGCPEARGRCMHPPHSPSSSSSTLLARARPHRTAHTQGTPTLSRATRTFARRAPAPVAASLSW